MVSILFRIVNPFAIEQNPHAGEEPFCFVIPVCKSINTSYERFGSFRFPHPLQGSKPSYVTESTTDIGKQSQESVEPEQRRAARRSLQLSFEFKIAKATSDFARPFQFRNYKALLLLIFRVEAVAILD